MSIDEIYQLINYVANKDQSGNTFKPEQFNLLAKVAQLDFINKRLGNIKQIGQTGTTSYGYNSNRKVHEDLRPLIYGPIGIPIQPNTGLFQYPYNYIWASSAHKLDWTPIWEVDDDQYPHKKKSSIYPPTSDYPVIVHRGPYGFIDPYTIGEFGLTYVRSPIPPEWAYTVENGQPVYDPLHSKDFEVNPYTDAHFEISCLILSMVGINLAVPDLITQFAEMKEKTSS